MKKTLLCILGLHLAWVPCFADVIPSKYDQKDPAARQAVQERLQGFGVDRSSADLRVRQLSENELAYFAHDTSRLQPAGGLYWYEWLLGAVVLAGITLTAVWLLHEYNEQN